MSVLFSARLRHLVSGVVSLASVIWANDARAQDDPGWRFYDDATPVERSETRGKLEWTYPTFRTSEYVATGVFLGMAVGGIAIPTPDARWAGTNPIDRAARDAFRLESRNGRRLADDISDVTLTVSLNYVLFDSLVVAWLGYDKGSVAYQMTAIDVETLAFTAGVTSIFKGVVARERPYAANCRSERAEAGTDDCDTQTLNRSFFSNHTSQAFAVAGLTCSHHMNLPLYGGGAGDAAACLGAFGVAGVSGFLRISSDNHNLTDVVVGGAFGTLAGFGLPWLLHYREKTPATEAPIVENAGIEVQFIPGPMSATLVGSF
jgi:membrane-associated phospholipid phosphatase